MDDALKARLIGAGILVVLAVALLPELLSGPKVPAGGEATGARGTRVITIDLGGAVEASRAPRPDNVPQNATAAPALPTIDVPATTTAASGETSEPVGEPEAEATPREAVTVAPATAPTPAPATVSPQPAMADKPSATATPKPAPAAEPAPKTSPAAGKYAVQVGAFSSADGARKLVSDLKGAGFPAYILAPAPGKKLHRVRVGPVPDRTAADQLASKLKARGLPVAVTSDG